MSANRERRILLVEDESLLRRLIAQFLRGEGFEIVEAGDGREGVERFTSCSPFDLVLLDLNLPILPGVEVCRRIKQQRPAQPVIICTRRFSTATSPRLEQCRSPSFLQTLPSR